MTGNSPAPPFPRFLGVLAVAALWACPADDTEGAGDDDSGTDDSGGGDVSADDTGTDTATGDDTAIGTDTTATDTAAGEDAPIVTGATCDEPGPGWLFCEDFEAGAGDFDAWFAATDFVEALGGDDRGRMTLASDQVHTGDWAIYYPASPDSSYEGADLIWYDCEGEQNAPCTLVNHDRLYFRTWLRLAEDHSLVHHFLAIDGSQPDDFWYHGTAGCLPNGSLHMGTTVDLEQDTHETFFYTYFPDMSCDTACERYADVDSICQGCEDRGLPTCDEQPQCCWGNGFEPDPAVALPVGEWVCLEMMMQVNTPGEPDGEMAYWINDEPAHSVDGILFRYSETLGLNRARLEHYITPDDAAGHSNRIWFDDVVVSTDRIGCQ